MYPMTDIIMGEKLCCEINDKSVYILNNPTKENIFN